MNFENSIRSVSTIAHELGHSLNSYYIGKKQKVYQGVSIFYAEIPSIVNEMLLFYYLLDKYSNNEEFTKLVLDELISNSFSTISRQIVFSNTEYVLNQHINNSQPFTKENIKKVYYEMLDKYCGIEKEMASKLKKEPYSYSLSTILRIPHFYAGNFYVYKYAIGQIVATLVADKLYHGDKQMLKKYFTFLSSGSSLSPMDTIKLLGIDLKDPKIYLQVKKVIDR
jgi:oligoendopeptidase F